MDREPVALPLPHTVPIARKLATDLTMGKSPDKMGALSRLGISDAWRVHQNAPNDSGHAQP